MDRKKFLAASICLGGACVGRTAAEDQAPATAEAPSGPPTTPCEEKVEFARTWIARFMDNLDRHVPEADRAALMEARGRSCARGGAAKVAESHRGDVDAFLAVMAGWVGADHVRREGPVVHLSFGPPCACPLAATVEGPLSPTYCHCSAGWIREVFETASGKPVEVETLETIKRGGATCRFTVRLEV